MSLTPTRETLDMLPATDRLLEGVADAASTMDYTWIERVVGSLGVPLGLLVVLIVAAVRAARWLAPRVDELFKEQLAFIRTTGEVVKELQVEVESVRTSMQENTQAVRELTAEVRARRSA